jgi:hypothetical protein
MRRESQEQRLLWSRVQWLAPAWARALIWASPIGERFEPQTAARLRAMGALEAGVPDLQVAIPARGKHGAFIELKRLDGGRVSRAQRERHDALRAAGYEVVVMAGADAAWDWLTRWIADAEKERGP